MKGYGIIFFFHIPVIHCYMAIYELFYYFFFFFLKKTHNILPGFFFYFFVTSTHIPCPIKLNQMDHVIDQLGWDEVHFFICNAVVNIKCFLPLFHSSSEATTWMSKKVSYFNWMTGMSSDYLYLLKYEPNLSRKKMFWLCTVFARPCIQNWFLSGPFHSS